VDLYLLALPGDLMQLDAGNRRRQLQVMRSPWSEPSLLLRNWGGARPRLEARFSAGFGGEFQQLL